MPQRAQRLPRTSSKWNVGFYSLERPKEWIHRVTSKLVTILVETAEPVHFAPSVGVATPTTPGDAGSI